MEYESIQFDLAGQAKVTMFIDKVDWDAIKHMSWHVAFVSNTFNIHALKGTGVRGKAKRVYLHRLLMDCPKGMVVDHIDGNGLNNRRENLRICTKRQNLKNKKKYRNSPYTYKGVHLMRKPLVSKPNLPWKASISVNRKTIILGYFDSEKDAGKAYNEAATKYYGKYARLNEIPVD